jgi:hypothetical protein
VRASWKASSTCSGAIEPAAPAAACRRERWARTALGQGPFSSSTYVSTRAIDSVSAWARTISAACSQTMKNSSALVVIS